MFKTICRKCGKFARVNERQVDNGEAICAKCAETLKGQAPLKWLKFDILGACITLLLITIALKGWL